jgi:hypothetical protein
LREYEERFIATLTAAKPQTATTRSGQSVRAFYEGQLIWDATMADSIGAAVRQHGTPIVHLVGQFHSDFDGGLTTMLRRDGFDVTTVSFVPVAAYRLRPDDIGRADVVIYTGPKRDLPPALPAMTTPKPATRPNIRPATRPDVVGRRPAVLGRGPLVPTTVPVRPTTRSR